MRIGELMGYAVRPGLLARLSGGRMGRAVLVLVGAYLVPIVLCVLLWVLSQTSTFIGRSWVLAVVASVLALAIVLWLMFAFGFWGVGAASAVRDDLDGGDQLAEFGPERAYALGWVRWLLMVVSIGLSFYFILLMFAGVQWWHLTSTSEIDAVPDKVAAIPAPHSWDETTTDDSPPEWGSYTGHATIDFDVPEDFRYADMEDWVHSDRWGGRFGELEHIECTEEIERCTADIVPRDGEEMRYQMDAVWTESSVAALPPSVRVDVTYFKPEKR